MGGGVAVGFRDYFSEYLPPWLHGPNGLVWARAVGGVKDEMTGALKERVAARFPIRPNTSLPPIAPTGALEALGREQQMPRALGESDAEYAQRLAAAFDIWQYAGTAYGLLLALRAAGFGTARICIARSRRYHLDDAGALVVEQTPAGSWCTEPEPQPFWSRFIVLFDAATGLPADWYGAPVFDSVGAREDLFDPLGTSTSGPVLDVSTDPGDGTPPSSVSDVRVRMVGAASADAGVYEYSVDGGTTWTPGEDSSDTAYGTGHLLMSNGNPIGLRLRFPDQDGAYSGDEVYRWALVFTTPVAVPGEEALRVRGLRQHIAKWKAANSTCHSIVIVEKGCAMDTLPLTFDEWDASGLGMDAAEHSVYEYHP